MSQIATVNFSVTDHGAMIVSPGLGLGTLADGDTVVVVGDLLTPHFHGLVLVTNGLVATGSPDTFANGSPVARIGDTCSCTCIILTGPPDTLVQ